MNILEAIFNYQCARQPKRDAAYPDFDKVGSVLLLYESEWQERNPEMRTIVQQLHEEDKQVVSWGYCKKDKVLSPNLPESRILGTKDFNLLARPKAEVVQYLEKHEFDVLIDLTTTPLLPMKYIAMFAKARFKIGSHEPNSLYDMIIQPTAEVSAEYIFGQIMHYLKIIKSADVCGETKK